MNEPVECIRCHAKMEVGHVPDNTHSGFQLQNWYPGQPEPSFWMGLKLKSDSLIPVTTFRCPKCGYLESFAIRPTSSER
jgi:hypothetical protein